MSDLIGQELGPYRVTEQLGVGGMATVYKAYHPAMDRYVAIKVLPQHMARDPNFRARFEREARTIARLEHRHILPVHDVREDRGIPYLVMRFTDGGTLSDLIATRALSVERAAELVAQVGEALDYAHRQGIVHRDIKPANVLIGRDGDALLSDFGIAKIVEENLQLTGDGVLLGTPFYMAPEQVQGRPSDARTDIYALGVILYETLTGRRPFVAETPLAVAMMHVHEPLPPPRQVQPSIPEQFERIILRAMAKDPDQRFQTAGELAQALRFALQELRSTAALSASLPGAPLSQPQSNPGLLPTMVPPSGFQPAELSAAATGARPAGAARWRLPALLGLGALLLVVAIFFVLNRPSSSITLPPGASDIALPTTVPPVEAVGLTLGLSNLSVFSNIYDSYGMTALGSDLWLATQGGVMRWRADGSSQVFTVADGLPKNATYTIILAPDGTLWSSHEGAVSHFRAAGDSIEMLGIYGEEQGLPRATIYGLAFAPDGALWAGMSWNDVPLSVFNGTTWKQANLPTDDPALAGLDPNVLGLRFTRDGALWIALIGGGLLRWDGAWRAYGEAQGLGDGRITSLLEDRDGTIWAAAGDVGLVTLSADQSTWERAPLGENVPVYSVAELESGALWASTGGVIFERKAPGQPWERLDGSENRLGWAPGPIAQTSDGAVWIGAGIGIGMAQGDRWQFLSRDNGLPRVRVRELLPAPDQKLLLVPDGNGALSSLSLQQDTITLVRSPTQEYYDAQTAAVSADGIWLGRNDGLLHLDQAGNILRLTTAEGLPSDNIFDLQLDGPRLWIGTDSGLAIYNLEQRSFEPAPTEFAERVVDRLLLTADGTLWAGSYRFTDTAVDPLLGRLSGGTWQTWGEGGLPLPQDSHRVLALAEGAPGQIWVSNYSGLFRWDGAVWRAWTPQDGAPNALVHAIHAINGEVLVGGDAFGTLYRYSDKGWSRLRLAGLTTGVYAIYKSEDGSLWVSTGDGLLRYKP